MPLVGCFCNGEVGPCPPDELPAPGREAAEVMGYATVLGLLRMAAPPPPADELLR